MQYEQSESLFQKALQVFPGGVNSPVRAFKSVSGIPRFVKRGKGPYLWDVDGNRYIDYVLSWGPLILGHAHPVIVAALNEAIHQGTSFGAPTQSEIELADLIINNMPSIEMIRFVNSGTEATMSALRLARAYTRREKIVKFAGCYHGHADMLLVQAGSGVATLSLPDSPGVPAASVVDTLIADYNDISSVENLFEKYPEQIAAIIVEPIAGNMGFIMPEPGFLLNLQRICKKNGALFILDEVMTGFRVDLGGAQNLFGLNPDLTCLGKVIGGGLPVGAYGGKREIMQHVAPCGEMYQAGTLSGNPLAMTAGLATLQVLQSGVFDEICARTMQLIDGLEDLSIHSDVMIQSSQVGTMFGFFFLQEPGIKIRDYESAKRFADTRKYSTFFHSMLEEGVYLAPSQFEAGFVSIAHNTSEVSLTLEATKKALSNLRLTSKSA